MRRFHTGFELDDLTFANASVQTGTLTISSAAAAARTGSRGLRVAWDAVTRGRAYVELPFGGGVQQLYANQKDTTSYSLLAGTQPSACDIRFYYRTDFSTASANSNIIMGLAASAGVTPRVRIGYQRSGANRLINVSGDSGTTQGVSTLSLVSGTWYRFHFHAETLDNTGIGRWKLIIYSENGVDRLEAMSGLVNTGGVTMTILQLGLFLSGSAGNQNGAQNHDFDDLAINDHVVVGLDVHGTRDLCMKAAATLARHAPTSDAAVAWQRFLGATNFGEVDEQPPNDDTDYVYTLTGASTPTDRYGHTAYGGGDTVQSVVIQVKHKQQSGAGVNDVLHAAGGYDGANYMTVSLPGVGTTYAYYHIVLSEINAGGPLSNSWYSALEYVLRKTGDVAGLNDKRVTSVRVEAEDDDGVVWRSLPHPRPGRPQRAMIGR